MEDPIPAGFITLPEALQRIADCVSEAHVESAKPNFQADVHAIAQTRRGEGQSATATPESPKSEGADSETYTRPSPDALLHWDKRNFAATKLTLALQTGAISAMVRSPESGELFRLTPTDWHFEPFREDGVDLTMVDLPWLRRQIGVVLQENVLFNCSVAENIALADPAVPMERIIAAAKLAGAHDFILELTEGYDTIIGERGSSLSGGQRQRIAIARALMSNPRILIFDEATSALDYESERAIQENMKEISTGRIVFIIAHRLSTVRHADRIITIERGRIVEDGSHDQLIRSNGRYAKLHYLQAGIQ